MIVSLTPARADEPRDELFLLAERAHRADGQPPFNDQSLTAVRTGAVIPLYARVDGVLVGAVVRTAGEFELVVDPQRRGEGIGAAIAQQVVGDSAPGTLAWAHGDLPASRRLAARFGFEPVRTLLQLRAPLSADAGTAPAAPDVTISPFVVGADEAEWLDLNALVFASHPEQGGLGRDDLDDRLREPWFDAGDFLLARDDDGTMIGYDWVKIDPSEPEVGEIYVLGVHPSAAGRGVGRALLQAGLDRMRARGCAEAALYVEAENAGAVGLYRSAGFRDHTVDVQYRLG